MNPFRSYTYTWWQIGVLKFALLAIGMIAGAYLATFVMSWVWVFIAIGVVASAYIVAISFIGKNSA